MTRTRLASLAGGAIVALVAFVLLAGWEPDYSKIPVPAASDLARELEQLRTRLDIPGLAAAVAIDGRIVWSRGFGWADIERHVEVNPDTTSFHLASVTKPYAATVVLQLVDEGRLRLDAPISDFGIQMPRREPVRVWHLLSHTSAGIPGTVYRYDARAFGLLTKVVERATGRPFAAELTDRIVRKLALTHTGPNPRDVDRGACRAQVVLVLMGLCATEEAKRAADTFAASRLDRKSLEADLATGYVRAWGRQLWPGGLFGPPVPEQHLTDLFASAGLVASATDVARFSLALDEGKLLEESTLARALRPAIGSGAKTPTFGLGWFVQEVRGVSLAWQFGQAFESSTLIIKIPARHATFVLLANSDGLSRRRRLGDHGNVLMSPAAALFFTWYSAGGRL
jgi:CubicO group peptidase (beta-lactamase class C family)